MVSDNLINSLLSKSKNTKLFFPSSATIYEGYSNRKVNEKTPPTPLTTYSRTKYQTQQKIEQLIESQQLIANIGIMFSHESEFRRSNFFTKTISEFLVDYKFKKRRKLSVGNISLKRDIGYAGEYTEAIFKLLQSTNNEKYIVSSNKLVTLEDFITTCLNFLEINFETLKGKESLNFINKKTGKIFISSKLSNYREIDLNGIQGDNSKIIREIGWKPTYTLDQICSKMILYDLNKVNK